MNFYTNLKKCSFAIFAAVFTSVSMAQSSPPIDLVNYRLLDLTYPFDENTVYWPTSPFGFELSELAYGDTGAGFFYSSNAFKAPEHGGTHIDAPIHFAANRHTLDQVPIEKLVAPVVVIDVSKQAEENADYRLTADDVRAWEKTHGAIPAGAIVMLHTGFGKHYPDRLKYLGDDTPGDASNLHFPSYSQSSAEYLVHKRKIAVLGIDTASIDYGQSTHFMAHVLANKANVPGLENVANLGELPPTGAWVMALPMKISNGSGGPVRIVALVPR